MQKRTHNLSDREDELVSAALASEEGYAALREYLEPIVKESTKKFFLHFGDKEGLDAGKVYEAGWDLLWWAMKKHAARMEDAKHGTTNTVLFSSYFSWCVRKGQDNYRNKELGIPGQESATDLE